MSSFLKPIGKVREMVLSTGLDISHFYDDLVIAEHSVFIIRFDENSESKIHLYFNQDCEENEKMRLYSCLLPESRCAGMDLELSGLFTLEQVHAKEEVKITFFQSNLK
jgi:hypothetical protein